VDTTTVAHPARPNTRELRALALYRTRDHEIEQIAPDIYLVSSQDGERAYRVQYGEHEYCSCPDHSYRAVNCVHILAVGIYHAKRRIRPELVAGDPFAYAGRGRDRHPHGCYDGVVYIGHLEMTEEGEEVEVVEAVPCRRCAGEEA
jgi:inorganic pyrophosphatase